MKKDNLENDTKGAKGPFFLPLSEIKPHLLNPNLMDRDFVRLIKEMSEKFTSKRENIKDYVLDADHVSSYTALYLPTNIPKLHFLLSKLSVDTVEDIFTRPFVDIGCGPGTYGLGMCLESDGKIPEVHFVDSSSVMLKQAEKIISGMYPKVRARFDQRVTAQNKEAVLFFGHSINELGADEAFRIIERVTPEYVMWIEPGTSALFPELLNLRAKILNEYDVLYPCPNANACPNDWCHQVLRTTHENDVERLSQLVSLDRKTMALVGHVYKRKAAKKSSNRAVVTRFITETKFSFEYEICYDKDGVNTLAIIEIQKKSLSKEEIKSFKEANVGETIEFKITKELENKLRVELI